MKNGVKNMVAFIGKQGFQSLSGWHIVLWLSGVCVFAVFCLRTRPLLGSTYANQCRNDNDDAHHDCRHGPTLLGFHHVGVGRNGECHDHCHEERVHANVGNGLENHADISQHSMLVAVRRAQ